MIYPNEILTVILATFVFIFLHVYRRRLESIAGISLLRWGYCCLYAGLVLTILEGFFWAHVLNLGEHILYAASSIFLFCWVWTSFRVRGGSA